MAPATEDWEELVQEEWDIKAWRTRVSAIKDTIEIKTKGGGKTGAKRKRDADTRASKDDDENTGKKTNAKKERRA